MGSHFCRALEKGESSAGLWLLEDALAAGSRRRRAGVWGRQGPRSPRPPRNGTWGLLLCYPRLKFVCYGGVPAINALIRN